MLLRPGHDNSDDGVDTPPQSSRCKLVFFFYKSNLRRVSYIHQTIRTWNSAINSHTKNVQYSELYIVLSIVLRRHSGKISESTERDRSGSIRNGNSGGSKSHCVYACSDPKSFTVLLFNNGSLTLP